MNDGKFKQQIRDAFEQEVPDVLNQIKASPQYRVPDKPRRFGWTFTTKRLVLGATSLVVIALLIIIGARRLQDPVVASTVTLEINPSIQITLDEDDNVIAVTAINDDGDAIVQRNIRYRGLTIEQVTEILINRFQALGYIVDTTDESNIILIEVDSDNDTIQSRVESAFKRSLETRMGQFNAPYWVLNARQIPLTDEQEQAIQQDRIMNQYTRARVALIYRIITLDDSYTIQDLLPLTVRELYDLFINLEDPDNLPDYDDMPHHTPGPHMNPYLPDTPILFTY